MPQMRKPTATPTRPLWFAALAVLAMALMLVGPGLQPVAEARPGASSSNRQASPSSSRRPRSGAIRSTRATPTRPTSAASANIAARVQRAASPRQAQSTQRSATPREAVTRARSNSGSIRGSSSRAANRRASVQSLTGAYRPADPAPLRNGGTPSPGAAGSRSSVGSDGSLGTQVSRLSQQVNELRQSVRLIEANAYHSGWMAGQAFTRSLMNEARLNNRP
jgi:hypothetical protein